MDALVKRKNQLLGEIAKIGTMRRGQLSEQYYETKNAKGKTTKTGPYYVWQASVRGRKRSVRVRRGEIDEVRREIEAGKRYRELCEELADVMEALAMQPAGEADPLKKTR